MKKWYRTSPDGTRDLVYADAQAKVQLIEDLRMNYTFRGYSEIITPSVEFYDLFTARTNTIPTELMYKMTDDKGRLIVLRPDSTAPIARVVTTRLQDAALPLKLHYTQNVMRRSGALRGRLDETTQSGVELIGAAGLKADLEVLYTAVSSLMLTGLPFTVELGNVGFFNELAAAVPFTDEDFDRVQDYLVYKNMAALQELLEQYSAYPETAALRELPNLFGGSEVLGRAREMAKNAKACAALDYLDELCKALAELGLAEYITIDLGLVPQLDYYTGLVFKGYVNGAGTEVLSGGRYDRLYEAMGSAKPAIGFAVNVDVLSDVLAHTGDEEHADMYASDCLICYEEGCAGDAYHCYNHAVEDGCMAEIDVSESLEEALDYARARGIPKVVLFGRDGRKDFEV